ncbi:MAG: 4Fe-4S binding protein [Deltaproteobacteria bacterium]|jgi:Pyruvate/2-oxoacid:ferredoxin oxidoreductase delta subunit|nr:4Fe-4S binding protein [Deltaproteobacteria bacterium]
MSHHTVKDGYKKLVDRINRFPQGAPPSELLFKILKLLFSEKEAELVAKVPIKPFTLAKAAKLWNLSEYEAEKVLNELAQKGIILDIIEDGVQTYLLPPPMAGFFEFSLMRVRSDMDQKALAELYYQYLNVEEDFIKNLFVQGETNLGRVFVNEEALSAQNMLTVLDYEKTSHIIETASHIAVGTCYCRHKMLHLGKNCDAPLDICLTFNNSAQSLIKHKIAREIDREECKAIIQKAEAYNLVQFGENAQKGVNFICNCCGCCCEALLAAKRFGMLNPVQTTAFLPQIDTEACTGCQKCIEACPVDALELIENTNKNTVRVNTDLCLGCGVCANNCATKAISMKRRPEHIITPIDSVHRTVMMAIERGKLQNLIFDNHAHLNHRAMAAILGAILKLPPIKQTLALNQVKSKYLGWLLEKTY